jgi:hypothetical protein
MAKIMPQERVRVIVSSHVPLGEDEGAFYSIKLKIECREPLSKQEEKVLERLAGKAEKWEDEVKSSAETEPENTLGG